MIVGTRDEGIRPCDVAPIVVLVCVDAKTPPAQLRGFGVDFNGMEFANPSSALAASFPDGV